MKYVLLMRHGKHTHVNPGDRSKRTVTKSGREDTREVIWKFVRDQEKLINCGNLKLKLQKSGAMKQVNLLTRQRLSNSFLKKTTQSCP